MSKLSQSFCLNLPNPFTGYFKFLSYFLQGSGSTVIQSKSQFQNLLLPGSETVKNINKLFPKHCESCSISRCQHILIGNEVSQMTVFFFTYWGFKGYGFLGNLHYFPNAFNI